MGFARLSIGIRSLSEPSHVDIRIAEPQIHPEVVDIFSVSFVTHRGLGLVDKVGVFVYFAP